MTRYTGGLAAGMMLWVFLGGGAPSAGAESVQVSGTVDMFYPYALSGHKPPSDGDRTVWPHLHDRIFHLTHLHPKLTWIPSDKLSGEALLCFSADHDPEIWSAYMEYSPYIPDDFGGIPLTIRAGIFILPFGAYNERSPGQAGQETISRPLMYLDHSATELAARGGPPPIFQGPYFDAGILLHGTQWIRDVDQLWYGVYVVDGVNTIATTDDHGRVAIERDWAPAMKADVGGQETVGARVAYSIDYLVTLGASYRTGTYSAGKLRDTVYGADAHVRLGQVNLRIEWAANPTEGNNGPAPAEDNHAHVPDATDREVSKFTTSGWYTQLDFPLSMIFRDSDLANNFELVGMYSYLASDKRPENYTFSNLSMYTAGLNYTPDGGALKYKLEYQYVKPGSYNATHDNRHEFGNKIASLSRIQFGVGMEF